MLKQSPEPAADISTTASESVFTGDTDSLVERACAVPAIFWLLCAARGEHVRTLCSCAAATMAFHLQEIDLESRGYRPAS